jgi:FixJ family two-component response regulator
MVHTLHTIAVVDDDPSFLKAVERLLGTRSLTIRSFESADQFLASLTGGLPDCLVLDLQMPGMSGLELQETLARKGFKIPTIILTSNKDPAVRERCLSSGAVAYLSKPVRRAELFAALDAARAGRRN